MPLGNPSLDVKQLQNEVNMDLTIDTAVHWYILKRLSKLNEFRCIASSFSHFFTKYWLNMYKWVNEIRNGDLLSLYQRALFHSDWTYCGFMYQQSDLSRWVPSLFALETFEIFGTFEIFEIFEFLDNVIFRLIARKRFNNGLTLSNFIVTME